MVEIGTVSVKGTLNTDDMERGQRKISTGFEVMKQKSQSTFSSMNRLAESTGRLAKNLALTGVAAIGGLSLLSGLTSVLGPEFAKLGVELFKLGRIVGVELKDAFGGAVDAFSSFVSFLGGGSPLAEFVKDVGLLVGTAGIASIGLKLLGLPKSISIPITLTIGAITWIKGKEETLKKGIITFLDSKDVEKSSMWGDILGNLSTNVGIGAITGATAGLTGGPLAGITVPGGIAAGSLWGAIYTGYETYRDWDKYSSNSTTPNGVYNISRDNYFNDTDTTGR